jgi:hypothetical protein
MNRNIFALSIFVLFASTIPALAIWPPAQRITPGTNNNLHPALSFIDGWMTDTTCLVWQRSRTNGWDIYYSTNPTGLAWTAPQVLANLSDSNLTPAVGGFHSRWVCAWVNVHGGGIQDIAFSRYQTGAWTAPIAISTDGFDDAEPAVWIAQYHDSIWVAWASYRSARWSIISRVYNGSSWSPEIPVVTTPGNNRAPRFFQHFRSKLLGLAWQGDANGNWDIYSSQFQSGIWTPPVAITSGAQADIAPAPTNPYALAGFSQNADLVWASDSLANFEIIGSMVDSPSVRARITTNDSSDLEPAAVNFPLPIAGKAVPDPVLTAWTSQRDGNPNIYAKWLGQLDVVDTSRGQDSHPTVTAFGRNPYSYEWVVWQSSRDGNWNLFGTYRDFGVGVEEEDQGHRSQSESRLVISSPYRLGSRVTFLLPDGGLIKSIRFFDLQGRLLGKRFAYRTAPGRYEFSWDAKDASGSPLPSGLYFLRPEGFSVLHRLLLLR